MHLNSWREGVWQIGLDPKKQIVALRKERIVSLLTNEVLLGVDVSGRLALVRLVGTCKHGERC